MKVNHKTHQIKSTHLLIQFHSHCQIQLNLICSRNSDPEPDEVEPLNVGEVPKKACTRSIISGSTRESSSNMSVAAIMETNDEDNMPGLIVEMMMMMTTCLHHYLQILH